MDTSDRISVSSLVVATSLILVSVIQFTGAKSVRYAADPDQDIDRIANMARQGQGDSQNTGQEELHKLLQQVQHKLDRGNGNNNQQAGRYQADPLAQNPYLAEELGYPHGNPDIDTYQPVEKINSANVDDDDGNAVVDDNDLHSNEAEEDAGFHGNKETVGYQKQHISEEKMESAESQKSQEEADAAAAEEEEEEEEDKVYPHPPAPQHRKAPNNNEIAPGDKVSSMADVYFLGGQVKVVKNNNNNAHQDEINLRAEQHITTRQNNNSIYTGSVVPAPQVHSPPESHETEDEDDVKKFIVLAVVAGCSVAGVVGLIVAGVCWYRLQRNVKAASEAEYPAYGVTGPQQERIGSPGDRKLAQSAQMYHYQHQKQQMLAMEKANGDMTKDDEGDSEEENEEGDYTVYECPGLAPTGEMEVKNPLFTEETPVTPDASHEERK